LAAAASASCATAAIQRHALRQQVRRQALRQLQRQRHALRQQFSVMH
jgi:hypothetical protein